MRAQIKRNIVKAWEMRRSRLVRSAFVIALKGAAVIPNFSASCAVRQAGTYL